MKVRFKEKVWVGRFEGKDDWDTVDGWNEEIAGNTIKEILENGRKRCEELEKEAITRGERIKVSCEVDLF